MLFSLDWRTLAVALLVSFSFAATALIRGREPVRAGLPLVFEPNQGQTRCRHGICRAGPITPYI